MSAPDPIRPASLRFAGGDGRYVADIDLPRMLHVVFVRSSEAHARLLSIDTEAATADPAVVSVVTGAELLARTEPQPVIWDLPGQRRSDTRALAHEVVRYVGEPIVAVVALTLQAARRAAATIQVRYEKLPPVATTDAAMAPGAPLLYADWPDNVVARAQWEAGDVDSARTGAALVVEGTYRSARVAGVALEGRSILAAPDPANGGVTLWVSTQAPHQVRAAVATCLRLPEHRIRVIAPDVGGAFGIKSCAYGEETLLADLAWRLRRPVRWLEDRGESFTASVHGRDEQVRLAASFGADGRLLGLDGRVLLDKGAEPYAASIGAAWTGAMLSPGAYRLANLRMEALGAVTNKTPTGAYRGYGVPEVNFALERTLDEAARSLGLDPAEIRRRNFVGAAEMPYTHPTGLILDSGRYEMLLDLALQRFGYEAARKSVAAERAAGIRAGIGLAFYIEPTNMGPSPLCGMVGIRSGGFDVCQVRMEPSGHVTVFTGQTPMGQGVEAALGTICADELTLPFEDVSVVHGDTQSCAYTGYSSGGSRGAGVGGSAALLATRKVKAKLLALAAHLLQAPPDELELTQGGVQRQGDPVQRVSLSALASAAYLAGNLPAGMEAGLEERAAFDPPTLGISYGMALVELEVLPDTDQIRLRRILFAHDCGPQIRPEIVEGQVIGGIVQGIGASLYEEMAYDAEAQPLVRRLRDYELPLAGDVPPIELVHLETPSPFFPHGAKGVGESGVIPIPAAIANAVRDALGDAGTAEMVNRLPLRL